MKAKILPIALAALLAISVVVNVILGMNLSKANRTHQEQLAAAQQEIDDLKTKVRELSVENGSKPNPVVTIEMEKGGVIKIELYPDLAPETVKSFVSLVNQGFYNGTVFHRIVPGFVIQGGDPTGTGTGGPGHSIKGEFAQNGFAQNNLSHNRGVISMARSQSPDSAGSQFFIVVDDAAIPSLDGLYAGFGKVTEGMDIVDRIVSGPNSGSASMNMATEPEVMKTVTADTFGVDWGEPEKLAGR